MLDPLLDAYSVPPGHFDELLDPGGAPRTWWASLSAHADLSAAHLSSAQARVSRQMHENGVTYNVYAAEDGPNRAWTLDVLPFVVQADEWTSLSGGLRQRARLLNALVADLYGPQRLLQDGIIPPSVVFRHPGYLRACHGVAPHAGVFLHLIAFDLARDPSGEWRVVNTRAQAPSGAGYALENRATIPRVFPRAFRDLHVCPLTPFFDGFRESITSTAPCDHGSPHIVLLTPGPYNETYFEHAYLAKHLGFSLVEGADLTVRGDRVFLKTISGLRPVHAILRRLDDDYCDPLELRADSTLGVPGLVQAWRSGRVLVANAFGSGLIESKVFSGLLPDICRHLLDEPLQVQSLATRWAGDGSLAADVLALDDGVIKHAFAARATEPVSLAELDAETRQGWIRAFERDPNAFVVEEFVPLSHAPVWSAGHLESRAVMLRVFLAANGAGDYLLMPGGLARVAGDARPIVSGQGGGGSKDTWALSEAPVPSHLSRAHVEARREHHLDVSSRAAEHLFWLGRYAERAESGARLLRAVLTRLTDPTAPPGVPSAFLKMCRSQDLLLSDEAPDTAQSPAVQASQILDRLIPGVSDRRKRRSLAFNIDQTVRVAAAVRDRLSPDNWRVLNQLAEQALSPPRTVEDTLDVIDRSITWLVAVGGLEMAHMTRDDGWRFLSVGRHLERLLFVAATLHVPVSDEAGDPALLGWLLELSDSLVTFRARYISEPEWPDVVELLLFDGKNPRSVLFQLGKLAKHVPSLPDATSIDAVAEVGALEAGCRSTQMSFEDMLERCRRVALDLSDALTLKYFSHAYELLFSTTGR
jgi:uncharacterized circularly permuted ATP-grasp superfamily protein/uncharacterized alpha-E superfamily protein